MSYAADDNFDYDLTGHWFNGVHYDGSVGEDIAGRERRRVELETALSEFNDRLDSRAVLLSSDVCDECERDFLFHIVRLQKDYAYNFCVRHGRVPTDNDIFGEFLLTMVTLRRDF